MGRIPRGSEDNGLVPVQRKFGQPAVRKPSLNALFVKVYAFLKPGRVSRVEWRLERLGVVNVNFVVGTSVNSFDERLNFQANIRVRRQEADLLGVGGALHAARSALAGPTSQATGAW